LNPAAIFAAPQRFVINIPATEFFTASRYNFFARLPSNERANEAAEEAKKKVGNFRLNMSISSFFAFSAMPVRHGIFIMCNARKRKSVFPRCSYIIYKRLLASDKRGRKLEKAKAGSEDSPGRLRASWKLSWHVIYVKLKHSLQQARTISGRNLSRDEMKSFRNNPPDVDGRLLHLTSIVPWILFDPLSASRLMLRRCIKCCFSLRRQHTNAAIKIFHQESKATAPTPE
jgi:hypothetical protein